MNRGQTFGDGTNFGSGSTNVNHGSQTYPAPPAPVPSPARRDHQAPDTVGDRARNVFVVHGRDEQVRREMYGLLRRLDLRPLEWEKLVKETGHTVPYLGDVVTQGPAQAQAALVLLTPDDSVALHADLYEENEKDYEKRLTGQPRPNVLIELGMVLMAYPERTLIVEIGTLRPIADINGRNVIRFDGSDVAIGKIVERLKQAGCRVDDTGSDWRDTRPFRRLDAYQRAPEAPPTGGGGRFPGF
jgi:predicted nucleotide-binding protein